MGLLLKSSLLACALAVCAQAQQSPPLSLAARGISPQDRHAYYSSMVTEFTGDPCSDRTWVIGLRGIAPDGKRHDSGMSAGPYGDTLVVVRPEGEVVELRAATHAGHERSSDQPWGVAQIRPGQYLASPLSGRLSEPVWQLLTAEGADALPAWLDRDGSGTICPNEKQLDEHYSTKAKGMVLSNGVDPKRPVSVGGQSLAPEEFERFVSAVGKREKFQYLLIDANNPVKEESRELCYLSTPLSPIDDFRYYERFALRKGVQTGFSRLLVVLRGLSPSGERHASEDNIGPYNDTFLVLSRYINGSQSVEAFLGSAHAGQASTSRSPGCYAGIAQLRPGLYFARSNDMYHGLWSWHIVNYEGDYNGFVPAWRDRDKDGFISAAEKRVAERNGVTASEILIHNGLDADVGNSIGCITMPPEVMGEFIDLVGEGSSFPVLVLDANAAASDL
jgi:hypothetical protein